MVDYIMGQSKFDEDQADEGNANLLDETIFYFIIGVLGFLCLPLLFVAALVKPLRKRVTKMLRTIKDQMIWDGTIRSITVMYMQLCIAASI